MRTHSLTKMGLAATAVAGLVVGGATAASARTSGGTSADSPTADAAASPAVSGSSLPAIQDKAHAAITARVTKMQTLITKVQAAPALGSDGTTLVARMNTDITGLTALDATIKADTTVAAARADAKKIFTDFRIYALVVPSTRMVVAADAVQGVAATRLTTAADRLQAAVTKRGLTAEQPTLDDMKAKIAAATAATAGMSSHLLGLTPAQWNADHHLLDSDRANLKTARAALQDARSDAKTVVAALRSK